MTPHEAKEEIEIRFSPLISSGMLEVEIKGKVLALTGRIEAVQAMDRHVMEKHIPVHCKTPAMKESGMEATCKYKFE